MAWWSRSIGPADTVRIPFDGRLQGEFACNESPLGDCVRRGFGAGVDIDRHKVPCRHGRWTKHVDVTETSPPSKDE
jgi:hypothetical protein